MDNMGEFFREHKYAVIGDFLSAPECRELLRAVDQCKETVDLISVNQLSVTSKKKFLTFNGMDLEENIPAATKLYVRVNEVVNQLSVKDYVPHENRQIGLSVNVTPSGGSSHGTTIDMKSPPYFIAMRSKAVESLKVFQTIGFF